MRFTSSTPGGRLIPRPRSPGYSGHKY